MEGDGCAAEQLAQGELKFTLHGQKLNGGFVLVRPASRFSQANRPFWLLIKRRDQYATRSWNIDRYDWSVLTGRPLALISPVPRAVIAALSIPRFSSFTSTRYAAFSRLYLNRL